MTLITQLSREDVMFVAGETSSIYQHVAILSVLDASDRPDFGYTHFREHCMERVALIPHFRWKLHTVPLGLDRPYWVEDENFSFDHHIKHIAVPAPGDREALCEVASHLYARTMDRSRPLWEIWLIEGLEDGRYAYLQKFHHCLMDGEGAFKMIEILCDIEPEPARKKAVDKSVSEARAGRVPSVQQRSSNTWQHLAQLPGEAARNVYNILRPRLLEQFVWPRKPREERATVPTARFNGVISGDRAMACASLPMSQLKTVKAHFAVSLNDVVLALVSGAVRRYLQETGELPDVPLRTNIPVSVRCSDDAQLSNKVTTTTVTLATDLCDPAARLKAINEESEFAKVQAHSGTPGMVELFQMMPPILVSTVMESLPADQAPQILGANLIVSNVRGSPLPMYIAGARMDAMFPMSILTAGMGINVTCVSYSKDMHFGIVVDPNLVPGQHALAEGLEIALAEYVALCASQAGVRPDTKPRAKTPAKAQSGIRGKTRVKAKAKARARGKTTTTAGPGTGSGGRRTGRSRRKPTAESAPGKTAPAKKRATSGKASSTAVSGSVKQQPAVKRARAGGAGSGAKKSAASTGPASTR